MHLGKRVLAKTRAPAGNREQQNGTDLGPSQ